MSRKRSRAQVIFSVGADFFRPCPGAAGDWCSCRTIVEHTKIKYVRHCSTISSVATWVVLIENLEARVLLSARSVVVMMAGYRIIKRRLTVSKHGSQRFGKKWKILVIRRGKQDRQIPTSTLCSLPARSENTSPDPFWWWI